MNPMLERVAWAIAVSDPDQGGQINDSEMGLYFWEKYREHYLPIARAAIEAMIKPTQSMIDAGLAPSHIWIDEGSEDVWSRMINAALEETT